MAIDLLGPSLNELWRFCGYSFSLKTTLMVAYQMIERLKFLHGKGLVHRDIKPDNFVMGLGENSNVLYLIDMGLGIYNYDKNGVHKQLKQKNSLTGTVNYCSLNTHKFIEQSRRDDLESVIYTLVHLYQGSLPWDEVSSSSSNNKMLNEIMEIKQTL